ncbi:MFS transporter [Ectopseudomonas mendocina]|uniref:MFS transporter n=1 Tax=Ectopseudomonas mendocina TaxID=300 RepID=A0ABZ2RLL9_ECTME
MANDLQSLQLRFGKHYPQWLLAVLIMGSMTMVLSSTSINVALPAIMRDFAIGRPVAQWLFTGYLAAMTAGLLVSSWAHGRFGARLTAQFGLLLFVVSSLLALLAQDVWQLIAVRIVQGACAGIVQPLATVLIFRTFAEGGRGMALGLYSLGIMMAPSLGPGVAGYLVDHFGWEGIFWMPLPLCLLAFLAGHWLLPSQPDMNKPSFDGQAFVWLSIALFAGLGFCSEVQRFPLHELQVWLPGLVAIVSVALFVRRNRRSPAPLLPMHLWRHPGFRSASWVALALGFGLYGSTYLIPLYLQMAEGFSAGDAGLLLLPAGLLMGVASFVGGLLSDRWSASLLLSLGLLAFALSAAGLALISPGASFLVLCLWACLGRSGLALMLPALSTGSLDMLEPEELSQGTGAITFVRQLGGAFGVNLMTFFLEWRHSAEGADQLAELAAFKQTFWLVTALFLLAILAARGVRLTRS